MKVMVSENSFNDVSRMIVHGLEFNQV